jgi:hypothetical protein
MRKKLFMALLFAALIPIAVNAQKTCEVCGNHTEAEKSEITKAIDYYIEGGRQGSSAIARKGFAENATMSWFEDGKLKSVPIQALYDLYDQPEKPEGGVSYKMTLCHVAGDVAVVSIESQFGKNRFTDMFTLVKDADGWKIVSKVYHSK